MEEKHPSEATHPKVREGDFRIWDVPREEVIKGVRHFLEYVGYELMPLDCIGFVCPDFRARRKAGDKEYQVVGVVGKSLDDVIEGCARLLAIKAVLGEAPDYVVALPPVNEYLLIEFFIEEKGRWFFAMKEHGISLWLHNPNDDTTWCILGSPKDRHFNNYFVLTTMSIDQYINMKLTKELLLEEEGF